MQLDPNNPILGTAKQGRQMKAANWNHQLRQHISSPTHKANKRSMTNK